MKKMITTRKLITLLEGMADIDWYDGTKTVLISRINNAVFTTADKDQRAAKQLLEIIYAEACGEYSEDECE